MGVTGARSLRWRDKRGKGPERRLRREAVSRTEAGIDERGAERTRTAVRGFAGLCLTTRPRRRRAIVATLRNLFPASTVVGASIKYGEARMYIGGGLITLIVVIVLLAWLL
jgi:hypothetical protein